MSSSACCCSLQRLMVIFTGNVAWAFYYGPAAVATLQADMGVIVPPALQLPTIQTRMISFYSHATGRLTHDEFDFFMHI